MNERRQPPPSPENDNVDLQSIAAVSTPASSPVVFAGDPSQVSAGFALALRLMGLDAPMPDVIDREQPKKAE